MNGSRGRDESVDQWLKQSLGTAPQGSVTDACLDAETLAAWVGGGLSGDSLEMARAHVADCARCQSLVGTLVRIDAVVPRAVESAPEPAWRRWGLAWLVPLTAAAAAVALYVAVPRNPGAPSAALEVQRQVEATPAEGAPPQRLQAPATTAQEQPERPAAAATAKDQAQPSTATAAGRAASPPARDAADGKTSAPQLAKSEAEPRQNAAARFETPASGRQPSTETAKAEASAIGGVGPPAVIAPAPQAAAGASVAAVAPATAPSPAAAAPAPSRPLPAAAASGSLAAAAPAPRAASPAAPLDALSSLSRARSDNAVAAATRIEIVSPDPLSRWRIAGPNVEHSIDGGTRWTPMLTRNTDQLAGGIAPSAAVCWVVGKAGAVLLTTDGVTWRRVAFPETADLSAVRATDARSAIVSTVDGRTFTTTDGGETWSR